MALVNSIVKIRLYEKTTIYNPIDPDKTKVCDASIIEIFEDHIITYMEKSGTRKRYDLCNIHIPREIIETFFEDAYEFIRNAGRSQKITDNTTQIITVTYYGYHKEVFDGMIIKNSNSLSDIIKEFVSEQQGLATEKPSDTDQTKKTGLIPIREDRYFPPYIVKRLDDAWGRCNALDKLEFTLNAVPFIEPLNILDMSMGSENPIIHALPQIFNVFYARPDEENLHTIPSESADLIIAIECILCGIVQVRYFRNYVGS